MSRPVLIIDEEKDPKLPIGKQAGVGGDIGQLVDSGFNQCDFRNIHIECGPQGPYQYTIKRIFLEFRPLVYPQSRYFTPSYQGTDVDSGSNEIRTFAIYRGDPVVRIDFWATDYHVNAVQFHNSSGLVSEVYGCPHHTNCKFTSFKGKHPHSNLVGVYGRFGEAIHKLGFTFAAVSYDDIGPPPLPKKTERSVLEIVSKEYEISQILKRHRREDLMATVPDSILIPQLPEEKKISVPERISSIMKEYEIFEKQTKKAKK